MSIGQSWFKDMHVAIGSAVYGTPHMLSNFAPLFDKTSHMHSATAVNTSGYDTITRKSMYIGDWRPDFNVNEPNFTASIWIFYTRRDFLKRKFLSILNLFFGLSFLGKRKRRTTQRRNPPAGCFSFSRASRLGGPPPFEKTAQITPMIFETRAFKRRRDTETTFNPGKIFQNV
jgi:hypothetical protein